MGEFFYHIKPEKMKGNILLPLSSLREEEPALAKKYLKDYKGRERLLNKKIDILDCKWEDVLFFSCLSPTIIFAALEMLNLDQELPPILKFPISLIKDKKWCLYREVKGKDVFTKCTASKYKECKTLPIETAQYFVNCAKKNEDPLVFSGVQHLLLKDSLDIRDAEIIEYESIFV